MMEVGEGEGEQGTSCGGTQLDVLVNECENAAWRQHTQYTRFNVSRTARYRPRYWFISRTSFPGSLPVA